MDDTRIVAFDPDTDDEVMGMPETVTKKFGAALDTKKKPVRKGYRFVGFSKTPGDAENVRDEWVVTDDVTLYAVWRRVFAPEDGENRIEIGAVDGSDGETVLVKAAAKTDVTLTFDGKNGRRTLRAKTDGKGYASFDLADDLEAADVCVSSEEGTLVEALVLPEAAAAKIAGAQTTMDTGDKPQKEYDVTVSSVSSGTAVYNEPVSPEAEAAARLPDYTGVTEPILINFDEPAHKLLFGDYRFAKFADMADSVISLRVQTTSDASVETIPLNIDASSHRYVAMKIRGRETPVTRLWLNFLSDDTGTRYIRSNETTASCTGDWSLLVFDMDGRKDWTGNVKNLRLTFAQPVNDTFYIDWILFTDTPPQSLEEIEGAAEPFGTVNDGEFPFEDVAPDDWYYGKVRTIWRLGFVNGVSETLFAPDDPVTAAQVVTLAVRIKDRREGREDPKKTDENEPWYLPYLRAAIKYKIVAADRFADYDAPVKRKDAVDILSRALPGSFFTAINYYGTIPDMDESDSTYKAVLRLYNAGILTGSNADHDFLPETPITRAELSTVIVRMASENDRERVVTAAERERRKLTFTGKDILDADCYFYCCTPVKPVLDGTVAVMTSNTADPIVFLTNLYNFDENSAKQYSKIRFGMRWDKNTVSNPVAYGCCIYYTTETETGYAESRKIKAAWNGRTDENGVGEFVVDLSGIKPGELRAFRFDPFDAKGCEFGIAYVVIE